MGHGERVTADWKVEGPHEHRLENHTESSLGPAFSSCSVNCRRKLRSVDPFGKPLSPEIFTL